MEMLAWLKEYLQHTPLEEVKEQWAQVENMGFDGPNAFVYLEFMNQVYQTDYCPPEEIQFSENMAPNFSGSFFLFKIAA